MDSTVIITIIGTIGTLFSIILTNLFQLKKYKIHLSSKFKEAETETNVKFEEMKEDNTEIKSQLQSLSKGLNELNDLHKYTNYTRQLKSIIETETNNIIVQKNLKNNEIERALRNGRDKACYIFSEIIESEFNINPIEFNKKIIDNLKYIKISMDKLSLNIDNSDEFVADLEQILRNLTDKYTIKLAQIIILQNGERRKLFLANCLEYVTNIYFDTIQLYNACGKI